MVTGLRELGEGDAGRGGERELLRDERGAAWWKNGGRWCGARNVYISESSNVFLGFGPIFLNGPLNWSTSKNGQFQERAFAK
jgi:hypothetical protein